MRLKALVTGGAGFIGGHLVNQLLRLPDIEVVVLDKLTYAGNLSNLATALLHDRFSFVWGDVCDRELVQNAVKDCDWLVHLASETHVDRSLIDPTPFLRTNLHGTQTVMEAALHCGVKRIIHMSTDEVYGDLGHGSLRISPHLELSQFAPQSPYADSKAGADLLVQQYAEGFGLPAIILRPCNVYGAHQHIEKQLPLFITAALTGQYLPIYGDGRHSREWMHVWDLCAAIVSLLQADDDLMAGEVFNVGTGEQRMTLENALAVLGYLHLPPDRTLFVPDRHCHVRRLAVNSRILRQRIGWEPRIPFALGLDKTIEWYRKAWTQSSQEGIVVGATCESS